MKIDKTLLIAGTGIFSIFLMFSANAVKAEEYCREFTKGISVGGHKEEGYGTACLRPDGAWEVKDKAGQPVRIGADPVSIQKVHYTRADHDPYNVIFNLYREVNDYDHHRRYYRKHDRHDRVKHYYKKHHRKEHRGRHGNHREHHGHH